MNLGRRTHWSVFEATAPDNPFPESGRLTYVYEIENRAPDRNMPLWEVSLLLRDGIDVGTTTALGPGALPVQADRAYSVTWIWGPATIEPAQSSARLVLTSWSPPGPIDASIYECNPLLCFIAGTQVIGPSVPEPPAGLLIMALGALGVCRLWPANTARTTSPPAPPRARAARGCARGA